MNAEHGPNPTTARRLGRRDGETSTQLVLGGAIQVAGGAGAVEVVGHASADGSSSAYDTDLSLRRAEKVCAPLVDADLARASLSCRGAGTTEDVEPAGPGPEDRRVEIKVLYGAGRG